MAETRKLYRSRTDRRLAGVCGGLAQSFNTDATLIRVLIVVLALLGGPGIVIYGVMWLVVPHRAGRRGMIQPGMIHPIPGIYGVARPAQRLDSTALSRPSLISLGAALRAAPVPG
jgi:phage shock protein C